ncbi:MAG: ribosomal RNA adenine dimethylase [Gammaproteobacteria bacterium]|nr:ribosomal RNA adenine dimethylase [Gammaproteobacteria bacterium]
MTARFKFSDSINLIKNFKTTGTITPSSGNLVKRLLLPINFADARCIVELGPGNGCVTRELLKSMRKDSELLCLEVNNDFVGQLNKIQDSRLNIYNACATSMRKILDILDIREVDYIVSSLPLALMDDEVVENILFAVDSNLKKGGRFLQYQYSLANYSDVKSLFRAVKIRFTLRNMPPAFVYECIK